MIGTGQRTAPASHDAASLKTRTWKPYPQPSESSARDDDDDTFHPSVLCVTSLSRQSGLPTRHHDPVPEKGTRVVQVQKVQSQEATRRTCNGKRGEIAVYP
ncbi:hypothetical protein C0Q70_16640 [Pomacea canaliculata]|uniref:Uncharacterized protein n=1 Tax=Pomacea canaliculata TaxID=400727 RepID=A0A2T7NQE7_POMCA|nr:hypothetical protein C0Q70_16640 [Pomacea canaliculata]